MTGQAWRNHLERLCKMWASLSTWIAAESVLAYAAGLRAVGAILSLLAMKIALQVEAVYDQLC